MNTMEQTLQRIAVMETDVKYLKASIDRIESLLMTQEERFAKKHALKWTETFMISTIIVFVTGVMGMVTAYLTIK